MLEELNSESYPTINFQHPGNLKPNPKMSKLPFLKVKLVYRIRCYSIRIDRNSAYTEPEICLCGIEQSAKHTLFEYQQLYQIRIQVIDKIPGTAILENWMVTNLNIDLILQFPKKQNYLTSTNWIKERKISFLSVGFLVPIFPI